MKRKGALTVEAALLAPVVCLAMVGMGNLVLLSIAVSRANAGAQSAALYGSQCLDNAQDSNGIATAALNNAPNASVTSSVSQQGGTTWITVSVTVPTQVVFFQGLIMPSTVTATFTYPVHRRN